MHVFAEIASLLIVAGFVWFVLPTLLRAVTQIAVNVFSILLVCYVIALFYTGTVTLADLHAFMGKIGPFFKALAHSSISAIKATALSDDDSWTTRACKSLAHLF